MQQASEQLLVQVYIVKEGAVVGTGAGVLWIQRVPVWAAAQWWQRDLLCTDLHQSVGL